MESLRSELARNPKYFTSTIRAAARRELADAAGVDDSRSDSLHEFLLRRGCFGKAKTSVYLTTAIARAADMLARGEKDQAEALLSLMVMSSDQAALDSGRWPLAWLMSHQPEPLWSDLSRQPPQDAMVPFTKLAHPTWVAAAVGQMKDMEVLRTHNARTHHQQTPAKDGKVGKDGKVAKGGGKGTEE